MLLRGSLRDRQAVLLRVRALPLRGMLSFHEARGARLLHGPPLSPLTMGRSFAPRRTLVRLLSGILGTATTGREDTIRVYSRCLQIVHDNIYNHFRKFRKLK